MELLRHPENPILLPDPASEWECYNVFNPGVTYNNGLFHMLYRAQGCDWVSRLGYAVSEDGVHWNRMRQPVLVPYDASSSRGIEDPRITEIDGVCYLTYTAYGSVFKGTGEPTHMGGGILPMIARSTNLITWDVIGPIVVGEDNKDHVLFPRKIGGRFATLHRPRRNIWLAYSDDLVVWNRSAMHWIMGPRPENPAGWDSLSIGGNGPPIQTPHGWLVFYHGYGSDHVYRQGLCLLDLDDPTRVLRRPQAAIFEPQEMWELRGDVDNVVFSCANPVVEGMVYFFYGGGDHVIGLATCALDEALDFVLNAD